MAATYESTFFGELVKELPDATADGLKNFFKAFGEIQAKIASGQQLSTIEVAQAGANAQTLGRALERTRAAADVLWTSAGNLLDSKANGFRNWVTSANVSLAQIGKAWSNPDPVLAVRNFGANAAKLFGVLGAAINLAQIATAESEEDRMGAVVGFAGGFAGAWVGGAFAGILVGVVGVTPVGWGALAIIGGFTLIGSAVGSDAGGDFGKHVFRQISDYEAKRAAEERVAAQIRSVEQIYGAGSSTAVMVRTQLTDAVNKLGRLDGTWMGGFTELSAGDKAALTAALIGSTQGRITTGLQADLTLLFGASWGQEALPLRDGLIRVLSDVSRDSSLAYEAPRVVASGSVLELTVPAAYLEGSDALRNAVVASLSPSEQPHFPMAIAFDRVRISLAGEAIEGAAIRDLIIGSNAADTLAGNDGADTLVGGGGIDNLSGGGNYDTLFGGGGDDVLVGGDGGDWLLGGVGNDRYEFAAGHGSDTIIDVDGQGTLWFGGLQITGGKAVDDNYWISDDRQFGFTRVVSDSGGYDLIISRGSQLDQIRIRNWAAGQMGLTLSGEQAYPPESRQQYGDDFVKKVRNDDPTLYEFDGQGNYVPDPFAEPGPQPDLITGSADADEVDGGAANDGLSGLAGDDLIEGDAGDDVLTGGAGRDELRGGDGNDYLYGSGAGTTNKPTTTTQAPPTAGGPELSRGHGWVVYETVDGNGATVYVLNGIDASSVAGDAGNILDGGAGNDRIAAGVGADVAYGGADNDSIIGMAGNDTLFGEDGNDTIEGDGTARQGYISTTPAALHGADTLDGGAGDDRLFGQGGADMLYGGIGVDQLWGDDDDENDTPLSVHGDDLLDGGGGNDQLVGGGGRDVLLGGADDDTLVGDDEDARVAGAVHGDDVLDGGEGNDMLRGDGGNDTLLGGAGADTLIGDAAISQLPAQFHGRDYLDGGDGNDALEGGAGDDELYGGAGDDQLWGDSAAPELVADNHGDDFLDGGAGNDQLSGDGGADHLVGGSGNDVMSGDGDDVPVAFHGDDFLEGGAGADQMAGGGGNDTLLGGDDNDVMQGDATDGSLPAASHGSDFLDGGAGDDQLYGDGGDDVVLGGDGDDYLSGDNAVAMLEAAAHGADIVDGGEGNDTVFGGGGDDVVYGGAGNDLVVGDDAGLPLQLHGNDVLDGGAGDDELQGGGGNDTYVFDRGYGNDIAFEDSATAGSIDVVSLPGLRRDEVALERDAGSSDLIVRILETDETLRVANHFSAPTPIDGQYTVESVQWADGISADVTQIGTAALTQRFGIETGESIVGTGVAEHLRGLGGNDTIEGRAGNDILDGGLGNDILYGGTTFNTAGGDDTYVFGRGYGQDEVREISSTSAGTDRVFFKDYHSFDLQILRQGNDLVFINDFNGDRLTVRDQYFSSLRQIEEFRFADGVVLSRAEVEGRAVSFVGGGSFDDSLYGSEDADRMEGRAGNDYIYGRGGDDTIFGGIGDDTLYGELGNDSYVYAQGDGRDVIRDGDQWTDGGSADKVVFLAGIAPSAVTFVARADLPSTDPDYWSGGGPTLDLVVKINGTSDRILIERFFSEEGRIEAFEFADSSRITSTSVLALVANLNASSADDFLRGTDAADTVSGLGGNDTIYAFAGDDVVTGGEGNDVIHGGPGNDQIAGDAGYDTIDGGAGNDVLLAGADGGDLSGGDGDDVLEGGAGELGTILKGGSGNDLFVFRTGMGRMEIAAESDPVSTQDTLRFENLLLSDVKIYQNGGTPDWLPFVGLVYSTPELVIESRFNSADRVVVRGLWADVPSSAIDRVTFAGGTTLTLQEAMQASIQNSPGRDFLWGTSQGDVIDGSSGNDQLRGMQGDDVIVGGQGADTLVGDEGADTLEGGEGNDQLFGAAQSSLITDVGNTFVGGLGADKIFGGSGDDVTIFGAGDGYDVISDDAGGTDTLRFTTGIAPADISAYRDGADLLLSVASSATQVRLSQFFRVGDRPIERVEFVDAPGTVLGVTELEALAVAGTPNTMTGTSGNDIFVVDSAQDTIVEQPSGGIDEVQTSVSYTLPVNVENITATGFLNVVLTANNVANVVTGNGGDNVLTDDSSFSSAFDTWNGGAGNDIYLNNGNYLGYINEAPNGGFDWIYQRDGFDYTQRNLYGFALPENVEGVRLGYSTGFFLGGASGTYSPRWISGNSLSNEIVGDLALPNDLDGGAGADLLHGGLAEDRFVVDNELDQIFDAGENEAPKNDALTPYRTVFTGGDVVFSTASSFTLPDRVENLFLSNFEAGAGTGNAARNVIVGSGGDNVIDGRAGDDTLYDQLPQQEWYNHSPDQDTLIGGDGNDLLISGGGRDVLDGGAGNDVINTRGLGATHFFRRGDGNDVVTISHPSRDGRDVISLDTGIVLGDVVLSRAGASNEDLVLTINGGSGSIRVAGYFTTTSPEGFRPQAISSILFANGTALSRTQIDAQFGIGSDPIGTAGDDVLTGTATRNVIDGLAGNDTISGLAGADDLFGGSGNDTLLGGDGDDELDGGDGNDTLNGGNGFDVLRGGAGDDIYEDDDGSFIIEELPNEGVDTVRGFYGASLDYNVENGIITGSEGGSLSGNELDNVLTGGAGDDTLDGVDGNDRLDGGAGADTMYGGIGDDVFVVNSASDATIEEAGEGTDTVESSITRTLGSNLENLTLTGSSAINGTGNSLANVIVGNGVNNTLSGGSGADTLRGSGGNDTYVVDNVGDVVQENLGEGTDLVQTSVNFTLAANVENLTLTGASGLTGIGNDEANTLTGNSGANRLEGRGGNDTLSGGTGADTMLGGQGDDLYTVDNTGDVVTESASEGIDTVQSSVTYTLANEVENLSLTGSGAINGTGNALNNVLIGNGGGNTLTGGAGNDRLDGGAGTDILRGGTGDDTYVLNASSGKTLTENASEGTDTVESSVTYTLLTNFEHLQLTGSSAINGTGNTVNNYVRGNGANNTLNGSGGNDVLQGGLGNDTLIDTSGRGVHDGGDGTDTLTGGTDRQFFAGGLGADAITLGGGADVVAFNRGHGADTIAVPTSTTGQGESNDTISLSGIRFSELRLARSGSDLFIKVAGTTDSIKLTGWYTAAGNKTVSSLQVIVDSTVDYDAGSSDPLLNKKVARLNFSTLVAGFDAAYAANPGIGDWAIPSATLSNASLGGSDTAAMGGQLAYRYGRDGNLAGLDFATASTVLADANFGTAVQSIGSGATSGGVRLMRAAGTAPIDGDSAFAPLVSAPMFGGADVPDGSIAPAADIGSVDDMVTWRRRPVGLKAALAAETLSERDRTLMLDDSAASAIVTIGDWSQPEVVVGDVQDEGLPGARAAGSPSAEQHYRALPYITRAVFEEAIEAPPLGGTAAWITSAWVCESVGATEQRWRAVAGVIEHNGLMGGEVEALHEPPSNAHALLASGAAERRGVWGSPRLQ